jgi:iron complex outermembrane receptor protein
LVYASYKESFRSGGFNAAAIGLVPDGATSSSDFVFDDESITAYEVGFKGDFLENKFRLNLAGYYYDFEDFQTTVALDPLIATSRAIVNTDQEIWGVDVEALFAVSENLTLNATYAYVDGNQDPVTNPATGVVTQQDGLQGAPENSFAVGFDYDRTLSDNVDFFLNGTYSYKDGALAIPAQGAADEILFSTQNLISGRIGINFEAAGQDVSIALWGENLLDDEYTIDGLPFNTFAFNTAVFGQPRTYGVTAGVRF